VSRGHTESGEFVEGEGPDYLERKLLFRGLPGNAETQVDAGESYRITIA
jgi:hypothetical protein